MDEQPIPQKPVIDEIDDYWDDDEWNEEWFSDDMYEPDEIEELDELETE